GQFQVESETELDDSEIMNQLTTQLGSNPDLAPPPQPTTPDLPSMTRAASAGPGGRVRDPDFDLGRELGQITNTDEYSQLSNDEQLELRNDFYKGLFTSEGFKGLDNANQSQIAGEVSRLETGAIEAKPIINNPMFFIGTGLNIIKAGQLGAQMTRAALAAAGKKLTQKAIVKKIARGTIAGRGVGGAVVGAVTGVVDPISREGLTPEAFAKIPGEVALNTLIFGGLELGGELAVRGAIKGVKKAGLFKGRGRPKTIQELMERDPQFRFAATREVPEPGSLVEGAARTDKSLSELTKISKQGQIVEQMRRDLIDNGVDVPNLRRDQALRRANAARLRQEPEETIKALGEETTETPAELIQNAWHIRHPDEIIPGMEVLANNIKSKAVAQSILSKRSGAGDQWLEYAKENKIIGDIPQEARMKIADGLEAQVPDRGNFAMLGSLRTPATRAARSAEGSRAALELQAVEKSIDDGIQARANRVARGIGGSSDKDMNAAVRLREENPHPQNMTNAKVSLGIKRVLQFLQEKFEVDRQIIIPRLRKIMRPRIEKRVRKRLIAQAKVWHEDLDENLVRQEVERDLAKSIPDDWGLEQYLTHIFPGFYKIRDRRGRVIGTASNKLEAKEAIQDLAEELDMKA
ncbi:hypothetical protein LCGC14_2180600, partial [marine sediment metagenome]